MCERSPSFAAAREGPPDPGKPLSFPPHGRKGRRSIDPAPGQPSCPGDTTFSRGPSMLRFALSAMAALLLASTLPAQDERPRANWELATKYSRSFLDQFSYSGSVRPSWIGETDHFWYSYKTQEGTTYWRVDPRAATKTPLFDHVTLAAQLSEATRTPLDHRLLQLERAEVDDEGTTLTFYVKKAKFSYDLVKNRLERVEEEEKEEGRGGSVAPGSAHAGARQLPPGTTSAPKPPRVLAGQDGYVFAQGGDLYYVEASDEVKARGQRHHRAPREGEGGEGEGRDRRGRRKGRRGREGRRSEGGRRPGRERRGRRGRGRGRQEGRRQGCRREGREKKGEEDKKTGDSEKQEEKEDGKDGEDDEEEGDSEKEEDEDEDEDEDESKDFEEKDERQTWANDVDETQAHRLTEDSERDYSFIRGSRFGRDTRNEEDEDEWATRKARPSVSWSEDSKAFPRHAL